MHEKRFNRDISSLRSPRRLEMLEAGRVITLALEGLIQPKTALDVGTGSGIFAEQLVKRGLQVSGMDASLDMLAVAGQFVPSGIFKQGLAEKMPFEDAEFDLVIMGLVLHETDDPLTALLEARRVSKQRVAVLEWGYQPQSFGPPLGDRLSPEKITTLSRQAGFQTIRFIQLSKLVLTLMEPSA